MAGLVAIVLGLFAIGGSLSRTIPPLEVAMLEARAALDDGAVVAVSGVFDLRGVLGGRLDLPLLGLDPWIEPGAEAPLGEPGALDRALDAAGAGAVVVPNGRNASVPQRWTPARGAWCDVGGSLDAHVYVRAEAGGECRVGTPAPAWVVTPPQPGG